MLRTAIGAYEQDQPDEAYVHLQAALREAQAVGFL
jgi:hypothetical protein